MTPIVYCRTEQDNRVKSKSDLGGTILSTIWEDLTEWERGNAITVTLIDMEVSQADRDFHHAFHTEKATPRNSLHIMALNITYMERVMFLRGEGLISPLSVIREKAASMVGLSDIKLRKALFEHTISVA